MADKNITKVYLLNAPLENDYKNTLYFTSRETQQQYFESRIIKSYTNFSYQRKNNFIRVPEHFDNLQNVNYVMYQNSAYSNKWFYAFVTDIVYIDDGRTDIYIETDYIQTWLFDYTVKPSFVEREHVSNDTIGKHTIPENLETGEYVSNGYSKDENLNELEIVWGTTVNSTGKNVNGNLYNGIYSGLKYYSIPQLSFSGLNDVLKAYDEMGKADAIQCIFMAPKFLIEDEDGTLGIAGTNTPKSYVHTLDKSYTLNGYVPHNNKLKCFPFNYLMVSNNNGGNAIYPYEYFTDPNGEDQIYFQIDGALTPGCSIRLIPLHYKGVEKNHEEGLNLGKYPICNWNSDVYINWLTQNSVNVGLSLASSGLQIAGGIGLMASGGGALAGAGSVASGALGIAQTLGQVHQQSFTPPQAKGNINCGDVISAQNANTFHFYEVSIKQEFAQIIDKYFDMFGYKVNMVKTPNKAHRSRWWYTKTIDVNIDGNIPNKDMQIIKDCYNNGITFWRNANEIQNYALSNDISITDGAVTE